jgi:hypothetical protein
MAVPAYGRLLVDLEPVIPGHFAWALEQNGKPS